MKVLKKYEDNTVTATLLRLEDAAKRVLAAGEEIESKLKPVAWERTVPPLFHRSDEMDAIRERDLIGSQEEKCPLVVSLNQQIKRINTAAFNLFNLGSRIEF